MWVSRASSSPPHRKEPFYFTFAWSKWKRRRFPPTPSKNIHYFDVPRCRILNLFLRLLKALQGAQQTHLLITMSPLSHHHHHNQAGLHRQLWHPQKRHRQPCSCQKRNYCFKPAPPAWREALSNRDTAGQVTERDTIQLAMGFPRISREPTRIPMLLCHFIKATEKMVMMMMINTTP